MVAYEASVVATDQAPWTVATALEAPATARVAEVAVRAAAAAAAAAAAVDLACLEMAVVLELERARVVELA